MRRTDIEKTAYPKLEVNITDEEVMDRYTLTSEEIDFAGNYKGDMLLLAARLKVFQHLLNHNYPVEDIPMKVVNYVAFQLKMSSCPLKDARGIKLDQVSQIRKFTGFSPLAGNEPKKLERWLIKKAEKQSHLVDLINEAIFHLMERKIELPAFRHLVRICSKAFTEAENRQKKLLAESMSKETKEKLDELLQAEVRYRKTPFYELKEPPDSPSVGAIQKEIELLKRLRSFDISFEILERITNDKVKHFSEIAKSYKSNELYELAPMARYPILLCFIYTRIREVNDNIIELLFRLWNKTTKVAERIENEYVLKKDKAISDSEDLSELLLEIIVRSNSKEEIVDRIFDLHDYEEYKSLLDMLKRFKRPKKEKYFEALTDRYSYIRRFSPLLWENLNFGSMTSDESLIQAVEYIKTHLEPSIPELPVKGAPVDFVPDSWDKYVFVKQHVTRKVLSINKNMYELCLIEQLIDKIIAGEVFVEDSRYYSSLEEHLISREKFSEKREYYIRKLKVPDTAREFINGLSAELRELLDYMNRNFNKLSSHTKIKKGSLSFSYEKEEEPDSKADELVKLIAKRMKPASIIDILVDVDKLTGFLDFFTTVGYREGMNREEKAEKLVATLLCYGGNFGPEQTERSTGVSASSILYMRRRYCSEENLLKAIGYLSDCQYKTWLAYSFGDGTGFITDGTMFQASRKSMRTEPFFRHHKGWGIIGYPLISDMYVALITQATTCGQYEAVQMIESYFKQKSHLPLLKNYADSHGQSLLTFAFSRLLHIDLLPRLRTKKHKMLYKARKEDDYHEINEAIHGTVRWNYAEKYYDDILRIIASFYEREASPAHILIKISALRNNNGLKLALLELGKACRSIYLLSVGINPSLLVEIMRETLKGERWHKFEDDVFIGHGGKLREDSMEEQYRTLLILNIVLNCITFWNTLAIQQIIDNLLEGGHNIDRKDLESIAPTMTEHVNLIGKFSIDFKRNVPFEFKKEASEKLKMEYMS